MLNLEIVVLPIKEIQKTYFDNLNEKKVTDSKPFWKAVKSSLSDKSFAEDRIHVT